MMNKKQEKIVYDVSESLLIVGGLNWGLVQFAEFNLVEYIAEMIPVPMVQEVIYGAVALSAVYLIYCKWFK